MPTTGTKLSLSIENKGGLKAPPKNNEGGGGEKSLRPLAMCVVSGGAKRAGQGLVTLLVVCICAQERPAIHYGALNWDYMQKMNCYFALESRDEGGGVRS
jgi:hypothetical protein